VRTFFSDPAGGGKYSHSAIRNPKSAFVCGQRPRYALRGSPDLEDRRVTPQQGSLPSKSRFRPYMRAPLLESRRDCPKLAGARKPPVTRPHRPRPGGAAEIPPSNRKRHLLKATGHPLNPQGSKIDSLGRCPGEPRHCSPPSGRTPHHSLQIQPQRATPNGSPSEFQRPQQVFVFLRHPRRPGQACASPAGAGVVTPASRANSSAPSRHGFVFSGCFSRRR